jgi:hypothetical protein
VDEETPEQRVVRLQRELADAKVDALQAELAEAQAGAHAGTHLGTPVGTPVGTQPAPTFTSAIPTAALSSGREPSWMRKPAAPADAGTLAPAPRTVPFAFKAMALPWSWWVAWTLFMVAIAPIAIWIIVPIAGAITAVVTLVAVLVWRLRGEGARLALLKWGEPAAVTKVDVAGVGTYYSGVTYQNVRLAQAHGWDVTRRWYSGPGTTTRVSYELGGTENTLTLHGLPYDNGVILADKRKPQRALCVSSFPYDLDRDAGGNWVGHVERRVIVGSIFMITLLVGWTAAMVVLCGAAA